MLLNLHCGRSLRERVRDPLHGATKSKITKCEKPSKITKKTLKITKNLENHYKTLKEACNEF